MHLVTAKGILSAKNGMNLYRGCTHGCIYCDSRSECYQMQHEFDDVEVKSNAVELLEDALMHKRKKCMIATGSMTDPYISIESKLENVRKSLLLAERYGFGFTLITKSTLVLRDLEILQRINEKTKCVVQMTLTTFDEELCRKIEPCVSSTEERFAALKKLHDAGIPTVVWLCPVLPFINDTKENIEGILNYCIEAKVKGIICFGMGMTLRKGNREYFYKKLDEFFPHVKEKYVATFGDSYVASSPHDRELMSIFHDTCERHNIMHNNDEIFSYLAKYEEKLVSQQMELF